MSPGSLLFAVLVVVVADCGPSAQERYDGAVNDSERAQQAVKNAEADSPECSRDEAKDASNQLRLSTCTGWCRTRSRGVSPCVNDAAHKKALADLGAAVINRSICEARCETHE